MSGTTPPDILIVGSTSPIGRALVRLLTEGGRPVLSLTRKPAHLVPGGALAGEHLRRANLVRVHPHLVEGWERVRTVVTVAGLPTAKRLFADLAFPKLERVVALSSNNAAIFGDTSPYAALREAEDWALGALPGCRVLQLTTVMGDPGDLVVAGTLRRVLEGKRVVVPDASTQQLPVHIRDIAKAVILAMDGDAPPGRYSVHGPDTLTYGELAMLAGQVGGRKASVLDLPAPLVRLVGRALPGLSMAPAMRRAGVHRVPVAPALPGFIPRIGVEQTLRDLVPIVRGQLKL